MVRGASLSRRLLLGAAVFIALATIVATVASPAVSTLGRRMPRAAAAAVALLALVAVAATAALLAGAPPGAREDRGPIICLCFDVGLKTIVAAIGSQQLTTVEAVGAALSAGTNCGSCRPSIRRILEENRSAANG